MHAHFITARIHTLHAAESDAQARDRAGNTPARFTTVYCACGKQADIWFEEVIPMCSRCYLVAIGDTGEVQR